MTKKLHLILAMVLMAFSAGSQAATFSVFENIGSCKIAQTNGLASGYAPVTKAPFKGGKGWTRHVVPAGGACLGGAYVMEDGTPVKGKAVYVTQGFVYWRHADGGFRMHDCSNPFEELLLLAEAKPAPQAAPTVVPQTVVQEKKVIEITEVINKDIILTERVTCVQGNSRTAGAIINGKADCPTLTIVAPIVVDEPISVHPHLVQNPSVVRPASAYERPVQKSENSCANDGTCQPTPTFNLTKKVPRTDGRCVVAVSFQGNERFIRLDPEKGTGRLMAMVVNGVDGNINRSLPITYVGGEGSILHAHATCEAAFKGFTSSISFGPTTHRLKLPGCEVRGLAREVPVTL